jgi:hypothetical protein
MVKERLDRFKASLRETQEALQQIQQTLQVMQQARAEDRAVLDRLCEHLMRPLDIRDYGIHNSSFSRGRGSPGERGSSSACGSPSMRGSPSARGILVRASTEPTSRR